MKNLTEEQKLQVKQLREWLNEQPLFPKNLEEYLVVRFLHSNYYDMDKAKKTAELFFSIRASAPELLNNRDPMSTSIQKTLKIVNLATYQVSGKRNIWIWQLNDPGLEQYDYVEDARLFFLTSDAWLLDNDNLEEDDVVLMDVKDITIKFVTKFNMFVAKKLSKYQEGAMPIRLKAVHIINAPSIIDKIYGLMKPFMKKDMTDMIHFHRANSTTLYDHFSKDDLPADFGGTRAPMIDNMQNVLALLERHRERLSQDMLWTSLGKKGKNKTEHAPPAEVVSLRNLAID